MPEAVNDCVVCGQAQFDEVRSLTRLLNLPDPFKVVKCNRCGLMWLNPRPTDEEYRFIYSAAYFSSGESASYQSLPDWVKQFEQVGDYENEEAKQREIWYAKRLERLKQFVPQGKTLLDVGAATGEFLAIARGLGWQVNGIELSEYACQRALERHRIALTCTDLEHFDAQGMTFDVVHLSHVFEHLTHPVSAIEQLKCLMHSGSILVIEVPNQFRDVVGSWIRAVKGIKQQPRTLYSIHHPYFYGPGQLTRLLNNQGLAVVSIRTHFNERWQTTLRHQVLRRSEWAADKLVKGGENLEVFACLKSGKPGQYNSLPRQ